MPWTDRNSYTISLEAAGIVLLLQHLFKKVLHAPEMIVLCHVVSFFEKVSIFAVE